MKPTKPSELEMQVLAVLWEKGPSTVRDALNSMPDGKERAYTTILSVMQVMEKKGLLTHRKQGTAHVYKPTISQEQILTPYLTRMVQNIFGGKASAAISMIIKQCTNKEDLKEIQEIVAAAKKK
ncbi:MAG: BlaI/MecI/CopY family transcriptional regulator [Phycisphaerae bacterium]|nr:BlaI/MecI/CopY family transcriptional regulator [Phycisphaerae bacterium]